MGDTLSLVGPALGSNATFSSNPLTAANQTPSTSLISNVRNISPNDGVSLMGNSTTQFSVANLTGQPATTPPTNSDSAPLPQDPYRGGTDTTGTSAIGTPYLAVNPRQVDEDDDKIATLSIQYQKDAIQTSGSTNVNTGGPQGLVLNSYSRFFLQSAVEQQTEKYQIVETFSDFYVFFYGVRPSIYRYNGIVLSDPKNRWQNDLQYFYQNYFRGTQLAERAAQAVLYYNSRQVSGFILGLSMQETADMNKGIPFAMDFLVLNHTPLKLSPDIQTLIDSRVAGIQSTLNAIASQKALLSPNTPTLQNQIVSQVGSNGLSPTSMFPTGTNIPITPPSLLSSAKGSPFGLGV
jgi:hypothetical protein